MKRSTFKVSRNGSILLAAAFLFVRPACGIVLPSGAGYQMGSSVIDSGGGGTLTGGDYASKSSIGQNILPPNNGNTSGGVYSNRIGFNNPPHFTYQASLPSVLSMASAGMQITLPSQSVDKKLFDITLNKNPETEPIAVDPYKITDANDKIIHNDGEWSQLYPNNISEMAIFDEQGYYSKPLAKRGVMTLRYRDDDDDGILDGSNPPVRINSLNAWILDESVNSWVQMSGGVDTTAKTLTVPFGMPGVYALIGQQDLTVKNVVAFPVPFRPNGPQAGPAVGQTGTAAKGITFTNLPQGGNINIYTLDGRLVRKIAIPESFYSGIQSLDWDVKTAAGERVASGVYIWRIVSGKNSKTGKVMVIW